MTCAQRRLVVIQRNPRSGSGRGRRELLNLIRELRRGGFRVRLFRRRELLNRWLQDSERLSEVRCLIAAGGDGTVADLLNRFPDVPLTILPLGTENLVARYLRIPRCGKAVAAIVASCRIQSFDSFLAADRRILLMLSTGADAEVVRCLHTWRRGVHRSGQISHASYLGPIIRTFCRYVPENVRVESGDGQHVATGSHVIVTNIPAYGFGFPFAPAARANDGLLDVRVFTGTTRLQTLIHAVQVWLGFRRAESAVIRFRCKSLNLYPQQSGSAQISRPIPVQCDGDPGPALPLTVTIDPGSLQLMHQDLSGNNFHKLMIAMAFRS